MPQDDRVDRHFILQQGLPEPGPSSCTVLAGALLFQPRVIGVIVVVLSVLQSAHGFFGLAFVLWWNALLPAENPFDAVYRALAQGKPDAAVLPSAAPPRRFAQALAGAMAALIGLAIVRAWWTTAYVVEVILLIAIAALSLGRFCLGSFLYHLLRGKVAFAIRTLPWGRGLSLAIALTLGSVGLSNAAEPPKRQVSGIAGHWEGVLVREAAQLPVSSVLIPRAAHNLTVAAEPGEPFDWWRAAPGFAELLTAWVTQASQSRVVGHGR